MASITAFEAKTRFGELLERVAAGEEVIITRHDKPVARMVPEGQTHRQQVRAAVAGLRALRTRIARRDPKPLTADEIRSAVAEGRR
jgi:prevent-host-death family protein